MHEIREAIFDEFDLIHLKAKYLMAEGFELILFNGGTGLSPRDVTPDALRPLIGRDVP